MKRIVLLGAAALPLVVYGEGVPDKLPPPPSYLVVDVDYWGTITELTEGPRRVGDTLSGSLRIDMRYAPSDFWASDPTQSYFSFNPPCEGSCGPEVDAPSRFVTTRGLPIDLGSNSRDLVILQDVYEGNGIVVEDVESGYDANGAPTRFRLNLGAGAILPDFISTDRISWLDFDITPQDDDSASAVGRWESLIEGVSSIFDFNIDRLRATPRVCRM